MVPILKNVGERAAANSCHLVSLLYVSSKVFEKLENNWLLEHVEKYSLFSDFQYSFRSFQSSSYLLTSSNIVSDRIARAFNRSVATQAVALDISKRCY